AEAGLLRLAPRIGIVATVGAQTKVGAEADVVGAAEQLRDVIDVIDEILDGGASGVLAAEQQRPPRRQADHTALRSTRLDLLVVDVAAVLDQGARVRVAKDAGLAAALDDLKRGAAAHVRAVEHDAHAVALIDHQLAEASQTAVGAVETAIADVVAVVVGRDHHAQAET